MSVPGPMLGPCAAWIGAEDVLECCQEDVSSSEDMAVLAERAAEASMLLYELTGRQFSGLCGPVTVRPCRQACNCWGPASLGAGPWQWSSIPGAGGGWRNECGEDACGCGTSSYVKLGGYPVREVTEVKIDGVVLDPSEYRLEGWRRLLRTTDPGPPEETRVWPACQDLGLDDDQPGTFSVSYRHGVDPPQLGRDAAAQLACQLYAACTGGECSLPNNVVTVVRQGVTLQRVVSLAEYLRSGATGLAMLDAFVAGYNPDGLRRRPSVFSPDIQKYARRDVP